MLFHVKHENGATRYGMAKFDSHKSPKIMRAVSRETLEAAGPLLYNTNRRCRYGKTISIFNQKGGVGKTTTCVNLAAALGAKGKKTLLVDVDPQGNSTSGVGVDKSEIEYSTYDILVDNQPARAILHETPFKNLDLLPANMNLAGAELELAETEDRFRALKKPLPLWWWSMTILLLTARPVWGC